MNVAVPVLADPPARSSTGLLRGALFVAPFLFFWVSIKPYVDLGDPVTLLPSEGSNPLNQATVIAIAACLLAYASRSDWRRFRVLLTRPLVLLMAWLAISAATSVDPGLSARRYVLTLVVFSIAAVTLVLPSSRREFALLVALISGLVLLLAYGGVLLAPAYAVHQATDLLEPQHAGHWRGPFTHKNGAGAAMVMLVFMGLFVASALDRLVGWAIALLSGLFLVCTVAKTSINLVLPVLALAWIVTALRSTAARASVVLGLLALINLFTVGSVAVEPIRAFLTGVMSDPTFTNRTDIWSFALGKVWERPWMGQGFEAFWGSTEVFFGESSSWANRATNSHSGYVDMLLTTGLPGLALALFAFVVAPLGDVTHAGRRGQDAATTLLFTRIWLFCVFYACLESFLFSNGGPIWFMLLIALFGLRFQAEAHLVTEAAPAGRPA